MFDFFTLNLAMNVMPDNDIFIRTAVENREGLLDKEATSHDDLFDSFRLSLMFWH